MPDQFPFIQPRPFLPFEEGPKNRLRKRPRGGGVKSRDNIVEHGETLLHYVEEFQREINKQEAKRSPNLPELPQKIQVIIETDEKLPPDKISGLGLTFIEEREEGILVTISPDANLTVLVDKTEKYISETTGRGKPKNEGIIAPINIFRPANRDDKIGDRLKEWIDEGKLHPDISLWVDVELAGGRTDEGELNRQQFYDYVKELNKGLSLDTEEVIAYSEHFLIEEDYSLHRALLPGRAIEDLLDSSRANWILLIDRIPEIEDEILRLREVQAAAIPPLPILSEDAPRVVVIDSGIAANHPLFLDGDGRTIVGRQKNFLPAQVEPPELTADEVDGGHGTAVASIAACGSVNDFILHQSLESYPILWVENAKIMLPASKLNPAGPSDSHQLHPSQLPKALMRQIVAEFHQSRPQQCKIFNLSVGSAPHRLQQPISNWAEELDNLSANNDVLFVVAAGNLRLDEIQRESYPRYLLDHRARLRNPAQAYTVLTVGAMTNSDTISAAHWKTHGQKSEFLANHPAPFSRTGLLNDGVVKPDVVEIGGNLSYSNLTNQLRVLPELSVPVANRNFIAGQSGGLIGFQYGTSMAAPKVANLAGRIQAQNPDASANLIRALIVNSAEWPDIFVLNQPVLGTTTTERTQSTLRLCGYGVPQADKALSANTHCMVFITEDEFSWAETDKTAANRYPGKVSFFQVPLEYDALFRLPPGTLVRVSITLAYNPPVRKTWRRHYLGVGLRWELRQRDEFSEDFRMRRMMEAETDDEQETGDSEGGKTKPSQWPWQLKSVLNPGNKNRHGNVIRDWFDIFANDLPNPLEIAVLAQVSPWRIPPQPLTQRFALVVSIESRNQAVPIYDEVRIQPRVQVQT